MRDAPPAWQFTQVYCRFLGIQYLLADCVPWQHLAICLAHSPPDLRLIIIIAVELGIELGTSAKTTTTTTTTTAAVVTVGVREYSPPVGIALTFVRDARSLTLAG